MPGRAHVGDVASARPPAWRRTIHGDGTGVDEAAPAVLQPSSRARRGAGRRPVASAAAGSETPTAPASSRSSTSSGRGISPTAPAARTARRAQDRRRRRRRAASGRVGDEPLDAERAERGDDDAVVVGGWSGDGPRVDRGGRPRGGLPVADPRRLHPRAEAEQGPREGRCWWTSVRIGRDISPQPDRTRDERFNCSSRRRGGPGAPMDREKPLRDSGGGRRGRHATRPHTQKVERPLAVVDARGGSARSASPAQLKFVLRGLPAQRPAAQPPRSPRCRSRGVHELVRCPRSACRGPRAVDGRALVGQRVEHRVAQGALGPVVLDRDQGAALGARRRGPARRRSADRVVVEHPRAHAVALELLGGRDRLVDGDPAGRGWRRRCPGAVAACLADGHVVSVEPTWAGPAQVRDEGRAPSGRRCRD